jgi:hypothetical protein
MSQRIAQVPEHDTEAGEDGEGLGPNARREVGQAERIEGRRAERDKSSHGSGQPYWNEVWLDRFMRGLGRLLWGQTSGQAGGRV